MPLDLLFRVGVSLKIFEVFYPLYFHDCNHIVTQTIKKESRITVSLPLLVCVGFIFSVDHTIATDPGKDGRCHHSGRNLVGRLGTFGHFLDPFWLSPKWMLLFEKCTYIIYCSLSYILDRVVNRVIQTEETLRAASIPIGQQLRSSSIRCRPGQIMHSLSLPRIASTFTYEDQYNNLCKELTESPVQGEDPHKCRNDGRILAQERL